MTKERIDCAEVQNERDAGKSVADLAETYDVSIATIYGHTNRSGPQICGGGKNGRSPKSAAAAKNGGSNPGGSLLEKARAELAHHEHMAKQLRAVIELLEE